MLFMACNTLQTTTVQNPTRTDSLLTEIHQTQIFPKNTHHDAGPTLSSTLMIETIILKNSPYMLTWNQLRL